MPETTDRRVRRTRHLLQEALQELILEHGYDSVTVQDILDRADVGRSTFYAHFRDKDDFSVRTLGVPGIFNAYRAGNVVFANAPGTGVADDKVVYSYVPDIIRYYLQEDAIIPNVPTWRCSDPKHLDHVLAKLPELVVKPANESGGYGMLVGPHATREEHEQFRALLKEDPRNYIAQPTLDLSTAPTLCDGALEPRHVDLRPFAINAGGDELPIRRWRACLAA